MPIRRRYADHGDACAAAHAFDVVGDRWSVVVIRELLLGPKRFGELAAGVRGVTPTVLSTRLRELEEAGVVEQVTLPPPARVPAYRLTAWGRDFEPILQAMGRWAQVSPTRPVDGGLTPDGVVLAMRTMVSGPGPRPALRFRLVLRDDRSGARTETSYDVRWGPRGFTADKLEALSGHDVVTGDSTAWAGVLFGDQDVDEALAGPGFTATGAGAAVAGELARHFRRTVGGDPG